MPRVNRTRTLCLAGGLASALVVTATPAPSVRRSAPADAAAAAETEEVASPSADERGPVGPEPAKIFLRVYNASNGTVERKRPGQGVRQASARSWTGEVIQMRYSREGRRRKRKNLKVKQIGNRNVGRVKLKSEPML